MRTKIQNHALCYRKERKKREEGREREEREGREEEESIQLGSTEGETSRKKGKINPRAISFG